MAKHHSPDEEPTVRLTRSGKAARRRGCFGRFFWLTLFLVFLLVFGGLLVSGTLVYARYEAELQDGITALDAARGRETFQTTRIYDRNGELLWEIFGEGNRTKVAISDIPQALIYATISVEDDSFYENIGLDAPSLIAALISNLRDPDGRPVGGSTITQQIVRHIAFDYEERVTVSYDPKIKEIVLAWLMNREYSNDEILEMYLNEIYYGNLAYGVEAAAQTYFGKAVTELSLAETSFFKNDLRFVI